jgi:hypothetical protein
MGAVGADTPAAFPFKFATLSYRNGAGNITPQVGGTKSFPNK